MVMTRPLQPGGSISAQFFSTWKGSHAALSLFFGVLLTTISLMMFNFGKNYQLLAGLIHNIFGRGIYPQTKPHNSARIFSQLSNLTRDVRLLGPEKYKEWEESNERKNLG